MEKSPEAFRTIREVAEALELPQHVLRFWETRFPQIRPLKRAGGRRYYRPEDIERLRLIRRLLYDEGYTIKGVQKLFKEQGVEALTNGAPAAAPLPDLSEESRSGRREDLQPAASPAATKSGKPVDGQEVASENRIARLSAGEEELAALRQALAEIQDAAQILARARSSGG
jgi:DNA-binding transcriptional MerR regulator